MFPMHTIKSVNQFAISLDALVASGHEEPIQLMSTIVFNPLMGVSSEEYSDSSIEQRTLYLKNKCKEAEVVILTLSKMFPGEILNLDIPELNLMVPCILRTEKALSSKECGHVKAISPHLQII